MKIFSAEQIKAWDAFTIAHEPISSLALMERAAKGCAEWIMERYPKDKKCIFVCGTGGNGGDGLAMARLLAYKGYACAIYIFGIAEKGTADFQHNLVEARKAEIPVVNVHTEADFPVIEKDFLIIDSLFGSGLNRPLEDLCGQFVRHITDTLADIVAIDLPSGMFTDNSSSGNDLFHATIVRAKYTLTLQSCKLCLVMAQNAQYFGEVVVIDIGLHPDYARNTLADFIILPKGYVAQFVKKRKPFSHKGNYGHALLIAGSEGKMGAAILAARACLRSNAGLLTVNIPEMYAPVMYTAIPEAMVMNREDGIDDQKLQKYNSAGIGPGMGTDAAGAKLLKQILEIPFLFTVIDADALTILSQNKEWLSFLNGYKILTPHPKEFDRLFGDSADDFERARKAVRLSREHHCIIILKGHYTLIAHEGGGFYIRSGNAGMAKGGSGDVLTGMITALFNAGSPVITAMVAVYAHGLAANAALKGSSDYSLLATDIIEHLGAAFAELLNTPHDPNAL